MWDQDNTRTDGGNATEFEWVDVGDPDERPVSWRAIWALLVMVVVGLLASSLVFTGGAHANTTFTASDVTVTGHAGQLDSLTVGPNGSVTYQGLESPDNDVEISVYVKNASSATYTQVAQKTVTSSNYSGSVSYDFADTDILGASSNLQQSDFRASDGDSTSVDVDVKVNATILGGGPNGNDVDATAGEDKFTVTVKNVQSGGGAGGQANTDGAAKAPK